MKHIICLSGLAGSGKSAIGKELANRLNCPFHSIGNFTRSYANKLNMDIQQFQDYAASHDGIDEQLDQAFIQQIDLSQPGILDYRLGFHFLPQIHHVLLKVNPDTAAERILARHDRSDGPMENIDKSTIIQQLEERNTKMRQRFITKYNLDFTDDSHYSFILDTTKLEINDCCDQILQSVGYYPLTLGY